MTKTKYKPENPNIDECGLMVESLDRLTQAVVGHRIVSAERRSVEHEWHSGYKWTETRFVLTLDNGLDVLLSEGSDCCASTEIRAFLLHPELVDHIIIGVGTEAEFTRWHIYADLGDVLELTVDWSYGNPCYYGYGFSIEVQPAGAPWTDDDD